MTHRTATGPDSVFVHAAARQSPASPPAAVCGYPLRRPHEDPKREDATFEERWLTEDDCCPDCGAALGLDRQTSPPPDEPARRNWTLIGAVITLVPMATALLARIALAARH